MTEQEVIEAIQNHEPFTAGNLRGTWCEGYERDFYTIWSMGTEIASAEGGSIEHRFIEEDAYSHSTMTSFHTSIVKQAWGII